MYGTCPKIVIGRQMLYENFFICKCIKTIEAKPNPGRLEHFHALLKSDIVENSLLSSSLGFDCVLLIKCFSNLFKFYQFCLESVECTFNSYEVNVIVIVYVTKTFVQWFRLRNSLYLFFSTSLNRRASLFYD